MINRLFVVFIRIYQSLISPLIAPRCRFQPTCSTYAIECFRELPFLKAMWYTSKRIVKCHPFHPGGYDPLVGDYKK